MTTKTSALTVVASCLLWPQANSQHLQHDYLELEQGLSQPPLLIQMILVHYHLYHRNTGQQRVVINVSVSVSIWRTLFHIRVFLRWWLKIWIQDDLLNKRTHGTTIIDNPIKKFYLVSRLQNCCHPGQSERWKYRHFDEIFVTGCTGSCQNSGAANVKKNSSKWQYFSVRWVK